MNKEEFLKSLLRVELIILPIILLIPIIFFPKNALIVIIVSIIVLGSRSSALYDHLKVEIHSILILVMANIYGPWPGIFAAVATAPLINVAGKYFGSFQKPPWILMDTIYLAVLSYIAAMIPQAQLMYYGLLAIILFGNGVIAFVRIYLFNDPISRRVMLGVVNILVNYIILKNFLPQIIAFFH